MAVFCCQGAVARVGRTLNSECGTRRGHKCDFVLCAFYCKCDGTFRSSVDILNGRVAGPNTVERCKRRAFVKRRCVATGGHRGQHYQDCRFPPHGLSRGLPKFFIYPKYLMYLQAPGRRNDRKREASRCTDPVTAFENCRLLHQNLLGLGTDGHLGQ